jgi:hypothetical protein
MWKIILATFALVIMSGAGLVFAASATGLGDMPFQIDRHAAPMTLMEAQSNAASASGAASLSALARPLLSAQAESQDQDDDDGDGDGDDADGDENEGKQPNQGAYCNGSAETNHPAGEKLAEVYDVTYEEVMDWFCQGYGFGEIALAYKISQFGGVSVDVVFEQRASGLGWGQIMQEYNMIGKGKLEKPGKPEDKPKGKPADKPKGKPADKTTGKP